jgi:hypothetical protein
MAIANLGELRGAIEDNLARSDLQSLFPVYVRIFESKFNVSVRIAEMEVTNVLSVVNGVATLPSNFLELRNVQGQDSNPTYYLSGNSIIFTVGDPDTIDVIYYAKLPPLVNDTDTNWLLLGYPLTCICMVLLLSSVFLCKIAQLFRSIRLFLIPHWLS